MGEICVPGTMRKYFCWLTESACFTKIIIKSLQYCICTVRCGVHNSVPYFRRFMFLFCFLIKGKNKNVKRWRLQTEAAVLVTDNTVGGVLKMD